MGWTVYCNWCHKYFILKATHVFKIMAIKLKVCLLCLIYNPCSHIKWNSMIWRFSFNHEAGGSIKKQENALFSNIDIFAKRREMDMAGWGCLIPGWSELHFLGSAGRVEIKNRWALGG